jgi:hypothetical protein
MDPEGQSSAKHDSQLTRMEPAGLELVRWSVREGGWEARTSSCPLWASWPICTKFNKLLCKIYLIASKTLI